MLRRWIAAAIVGGGLTPPAAAFQVESGFELGCVLGALYGKAIYCGVDDARTRPFPRLAIAAVDDTGLSAEDRLAGVEQFAAKAALGFNYGPKWVAGETCAGVEAAFAAAERWLAERRRR